MATKKEDVLTWLRDAHAMEAANIDNLQQLIGRADDYPQLKTQLQRHLDISKRQRDEIEQLLKKLGSDTSTLKDLAMRLAGRIQPLLAGVTPDEMPKNCIAAHAWENFEIASYRSLIGGADDVGLADVKQLCERFIREEQEMATFLFDQLPAITRQYLQRRAS
jgi:ferritin-like metal-binding protein YciE